MKQKFIVAALAAVLVISGSSTEASARSFTRSDYKSVDEWYSAIRELAASNPEHVTLIEYGKSVENRPLIAIKITAGNGAQHSEALVTGGIHATEFLGDLMAFEVAKRLATGYGKDPDITNIVNRVDFYVIPMLNPDGYNIAYRHLSRGFTAARRNAGRVDLNRNFPYPKGTKLEDYRAGSKRRWHPNYMGARPLSEPETTALDKFVAGRKFFVAINFHTTGGHFLYPYGFSGNETPDVSLFKSMGESFNAKQIYTKYKVHQAYSWYQTVGDLDDWLYGKYGILSVTVELGKPDKRLLNPLRAYNLFYWYNPVEVAPWIENDRDAAIAAIRDAYESSGGVPREPQNFDWNAP